MGDEPQLFVHERSADPAQAELAILTSVRSPHPVSELLFGKFCEHLGANIYNGMEAQILRNPTFGAWPFHGGSKPDGGYSPSADPEKARAALIHQKPGWSTGDVEPLVEAYQDGCAMLWYRTGPREHVRFSPDVGPNRCRAQRLEIVGQPPPRCGIAQRTFLPLHRTRGYEFRAMLRAYAPAEMTLSISQVGPDGAPAPPIATENLQIGTEWTTCTAHLDLPPDAPDDGAYELSLTSAAPANVVLASVMLYPDDHLDGADPDVIRALKEARLPMLRWPGGNFVSGYHWRDGVGPVHLRPTVPNPAWASLEPNYFGTDEFIAFCRRIDCLPLICLNAGTASPQEAAAWVEYCNGAPETPMGRLRAENGHPEPHAVRYWEVGNEIYGRWQVNWTTPGGYADRYKRFARAMREVDPSIRILACGFEPGGEWDRTLIAEAGAELSSITHHILVGGEVDETIDPKDLFHAFMAYPARLFERYRDNQRAMRDAGAVDPRIAITEMQLFARYRRKETGSGPPERPPIPAPDTISEVLYVATVIDECIRTGDLVEMLTHSATVNHGGGLRKTAERVWATPVHHAHVMGADLAGGTPVGMRLTCGVVSTAGPTGELPAAVDLPILDATGVLTAGGALLVMLVHRSAATGPVRLTIDLGDFPAARDAEVVTLAGESVTDRNTHDDPERIVPRRSTAAVENGKVHLTIPPLSLTRLRLSKANG